ncbi:kinesin-domain-containing protein [Testicularia cyperi]|uniref:Kinesin-domain-containing protein n=1 Tax=Testicularia cyperi TaxID=1882483 RepID=A0A317XQY8_9BASI|nr:kinesin-domain-containing protein [Testicularia cyperi]
MAESSINVCVRVRPFSDKEASQLAPNEDVTPFLGDGGLGGSPDKQILAAVNATASLRTRFIRPIVKPMDQKVLVFDPPDTNPLTRLYSGNSLAYGSKRNKDVRYAFDRIFDATASQHDVFQETCKPLLDGVLNGYNASVFAYGATGCGKTHTISGTPQDPGLIFLTLKELYDRIADARDESEVHVRLSYLEIYNETIRDLLSAEPTPPGAGLALREDANNKISVVGITELTPQSPESVLEYIQEGNSRRTMSPTEANAVSSRSHAVLQINVTQKPRTASMTEETTSASLNIIDLAGSERASATRNNGARMKEGANINKSLLALGNCINALCQSGGARKHVPYRNSKLTRLLKFSLGGNCKTVMVVCISPSSAHYEETHNALKYANQAKNIRTKVSRNMINVDRHVAQYVQAIHELKEENARLKARLEERGSLETAAEKRKRVEMGREVEEAKKRMRESTDNVTRLVRDKAGLEAESAAAEAGVAELRKRLVQVETELAVFSGRNEPPPSDLEGEKDVLRGLIQRHESTLHNDDLKSGVRSLLNSLQMQRGIIVAASHNQKFDSDAAESVKNLGASMLAEIEAVKSKVKFDAVLEIVRRTTGDVTGLVTVAARSTVALREVAGELEYRASNSSNGGGAEAAGGGSGSGTVEDLKATLELLASQLRSISDENDKVFHSLSGARLPAISQAGTGGSSSATSGGASGSSRSGSNAASALRRSRTSLALSRGPVSTHGKGAGAGMGRSTSSAALSRGSGGGSGGSGGSALGRRASVAPTQGISRSTSMQVASSPGSAASTHTTPATSASSGGTASRSVSTAGGSGPVRSARPSFAAPTSSSAARSHAGIGGGNASSSSSLGSPGRKASSSARRVSGATRRMSASLRHGGSRASGSGSGSASAGAGSLGSVAPAPHPASSAAGVGIVNHEEKKKFRWADEAGEGSIDDKGLGAVGGSDAKSGVRFSVDSDDASTSGSGNEWEDLSDGRSTPAGAAASGGKNVVPIKTSSGRSASVGRLQTTGGAPGNAGSTGLFDRSAFANPPPPPLSGASLTTTTTGSASTRRSVSASASVLASTPLPSLDEDTVVEAPHTLPKPEAFDDGSSTSESGFHVAPRQVFRQLNAGTAGNSLLNGTGLFNALGNVHIGVGGAGGGSVANKPFPRPSAGGPGPVRRRMSTLRSRTSIAATPFLGSVPPQVSGSLSQLLSASTSAPPAAGASAAGTGSNSSTNQSFLLLTATRDV